MVAQQRFTGKKRLMHTALNIAMLFFGQRIAKDYSGATSLVPYFIVCIGEILLLTL